ncbi:hypothetical protein [Erysipelothrix larvae]|uniref:hypothetical protein n=1 Tax=Erysipelothrix larvae TaxID=1514105 RepID=UPI000B1221CE|nr:hypothetical protein [Erysipelothrix larvae]
MKKKNESESLEDVFVGLVKGAVIGGIIMALTQNPSIGLIAFVFGATGLPDFLKRK